MLAAIWFLPFIFTTATSARVFGARGSSRTHKPDPKPVFVIHGFTRDAASTAYLAEKLVLDNPNRIVFNTDAYSTFASTVSLWKQIWGDMGKEFRKFSDTYPDGIHCIGHSMGALLCKSLVETYPEHNVHNIISLAGPLAGLYGISAIPRISPFSEVFMPFLQIAPILKSVSWFMYQTITQDNLAMANFWRDPYWKDGYLSMNKFLPFIDNERVSNKSKSFKESFLKLKKFVVLASPADEVIVPWESSGFDFFDENGDVESYKSRRIYKEDLFGLRTLEERGGFIRHDVEEVKHMQWTVDDELINKYIIPYLD